MACPSTVGSFGSVPLDVVGSGLANFRMNLCLGVSVVSLVSATCPRAALALVYHPMLGRLVQCPRAAWLWLAIHVWTFLGFFASRVSSWGHAVAWSCVPRATNLAVYWQVNRKLVGNCSLRRWSVLVDLRPLAYHASSRGGRGSGGRSIFAPLGTDVKRRRW